ncbi:MAG: preprotein translocase subunit SecE [Pirellulales bacterium]
MSGFLQELFHASLYKRNQGRVARQVTFAAMALIVVLGVWDMSQMSGSDMAYRFLLPGVMLAMGLWIAYRLVNWPPFADFLISVEAEMTKVSWPGRTELIRSSLVVMFTIFFLATILFAYDLFWKKVLELLGVLN